jgi:hypothetical protein
MATRKTASLDGTLIARKGTAVPAQASPTLATKDTIAVTVRLDPELYLALKGRDVSFRPRKTNQDMIVEAIKAYLGKESPEAD